MKCPSRELLKKSDHTEWSQFFSDRRNACPSYSSIDVAVAFVKIIPRQGSCLASRKLAARVVLPEPAGPAIQTRGFSNALSRRRKSLVLGTTSERVGRVIFAGEGPLLFTGASRRLYRHIETLQELPSRAYVIPFFYNIITANTFSMLSFLTS